MILIESITSILIFAYVVILSILVEKIVDITGVIQYRSSGIGSSFVKRGKLTPNLSRLKVFLLRYFEIFVIAILSVFIENTLIKPNIETSWAFLIPLFILFIPISMLIIYLVTPKESQKYFSPRPFEIFFIILTLILGFLLIYLLW